MIYIDKQDYRNVHGKDPRGYGHWAFHFGGYSYGKVLADRYNRDFEFFGTFGDALKAAKKAFRSAHDHERYPEVPPPYQNHQGHPLLVCGDP